ncbi:MAG TPA: type II toxin-antitoxin system death-on-curing family toxin [Roseiflexaceae bacterium]|nr:type II toxin-antitoxin system death-on-curing family toxin [Roseiflexaceae bacterium]
MVYLALEDILAIRDQVSAAYAEQFEVMAFNGLMSALAAPQRSAFGVEVFPTLPEKAGALVYSLIQHHPFWDGNKRIATAALKEFLERNGARLTADEVEFRQFTREIALGRVRDGAVSVWLGEQIQ